MTAPRVHFPILRRRARYGDYSTYLEYRQEIREDYLGRCVYCDMHENEIGGTHKMTLDHFCPKSRYPRLVNEPTNLMFACRKCNLLKANWWPTGDGSEALIEEGGFVDPFEVDRAEYFRVTAHGLLEALQRPAMYEIRILELNRQMLVNIRRIRNNTCSYVFDTLELIDEELHKSGLSTEEEMKLRNERCMAEDDLKELLECLFSLRQA